METSIHPSRHGQHTKQLCVDGSCIPVLRAQRTGSILALDKSVMLGYLPPSSFVSTCSSAKWADNISLYSLGVSELANE